MIVLYDKANVPHILAEAEEYHIKHKLDGCDRLFFSLSTLADSYKLLYEEASIDDGTNKWLIKKIDDDRVECELDFDFLKGNFYKEYKSDSLTLVQILNLHMPSTWTIEGANVSAIRRTIELEGVTDYEIIMQCMKTYSVYFMWNMKTKVLRVVAPELMPITGEYITSELNLSSLSFKGETTAFATRLYAYGKDDITIEEAIVDGERYGLTYVENNDYSEKTISTYWKDERYTDVDSLYAAAVEKLSVLSIPNRSYECDVIDLAKNSEDYTFLEFSMHKKVTLIDVDRGLRVVHHIVEYDEYPDEPSRNKITLAVVPETVETRFERIADNVEKDNLVIRSEYSQQIAFATAMITGAFGGHIVHTGDGDLLICDNADPNLAQVVWRFNVNGIAKSFTGIEGPYTTAITVDDQFITNIIQGMIIRGDYIEAGTVSADKIEQKYTDDIIEQSSTIASGKVESAIADRLDGYDTKFVQTADNFTALMSEINELYSKIAELRATAEGLSLSITNIQNDGVSSIRTSTGYTFGADGLNISKEGEEMENKLDNTGLYVSRSGEPILTANNEGVEAINLHARQYLIVGSNDRFEDYSTASDPHRTGAFYVGPDW